MPAVFTVNATTDSGSGAGNAGDLRYCMTQAQEAFSPGVDIINFDATVFGSATTIALTGQLPTIDNGLTITGTGSSKVILQMPAGTDAPIRTDASFVDGQSISITGLKMTDATAFGDMFLFIEDANLKLTDVAFTNGKSAGLNPFGLNLRASNPGGFTPTITLTNCLFTGNTATAAPAGSFVGGGVNVVGCNLVVSGTTITNNDWRGTAGTVGGFSSAGIRAEGNAAANLGAGNSLTITNSTISGNKSFEIGTVYVLGTHSAISITDTKIENNTAGRGAGIWSNVGTADVQIVRSSISGNAALVTGTTAGTSGRAGGMYLTNAKSVMIDSSSFNFNTGKNLAGAIWIDAIVDGPNSALITNSTFANNSVTSSGGIMRFGQALTQGDTFNFRNCTFANNTSTLGNFRWFGGSLDFESCIFDNQVGGTGPNVAAFGTVGVAPLGTTKVRESLLSSTAGMPAGFDDGNNLLNVPGQLNAPGDNGGGFITIRPQAMSPVINAGTNPLGLTFDQRGGPLHVRSFNGGVDMGAIEAVSFIPYVSGTVTDGTVTASNVSKYSIAVTYTDDTQNFDATSIGTGDIRITGKAFPSGIDATFDKLDTPGDGNPKTAYYFVNSPGAFFVPADNGTYTISVVANQVKTVDTRFVPAATVASFNIAVSQNFIVDTIFDTVDPFDGQTSLREAVSAANASPATDSISFSALFNTSQTMTLDGMLGGMLVTDDLVINAPGARVEVDAAALLANAKGATFAVGANNFSISNFRIINGDRAIQSTSTQNITIVNCEFSGNTSGAGGAVYLNAGSMSIIGSRFVGNTGSSGGAIYLRIGDVVIDRSSFENNTAGGTGGAIDCNFNANFAVDLTIRNSTFSGNTSTAAGGAIYADQLKNFLMENSTISGNSGTSGGGLAVIVTATQKGSTVIRNSTITQNKSTGTGAGGVDITQPTADLVSIVSTVLADNTQTGNTKPDYSGPTTSQFSRSLLGVANSFTPSSVDLTTGNNLFGSDTSPLSPKLNALSLNLAPPGSPLSHAPQAGSPVLDAGDNPTPTLTFDQRGTGFPRTLNGKTDIGSIEGVLPIPSGSLNPLGPIVTPGATPNTVQVVYTDDVGINVSTIDITDIEIIQNKTSTPLTIQSVSVSPPGNGSPRTATYTFAVPGGAWDGADNGTYTVNLMNGAVSDTDPVPNTNLGATLGTFKVTLLSTYLVDKVEDLDDFNTGPGELTLREAIRLANDDEGPSTINFSAGKFNAPITLKTDAGQMAINQAITINGPAQRLTLQGNGSDRIFNMFGAPGLSVIVISNLTLTEGKRLGNDTSTNDTMDRGGAILIGNEDVTLNNCTISNSVSAVQGGAIHLEEEPARLTLNDCIITGNSSTGAFGGAGGQGGGAISVGQGNADTLIALNRTTVSGNTTAGAGGGIYFANNGSLLMTDSTVSGNTATGASGGGGVYFFGTVGTSGFKVTNSTVSGNSATGGPGGGLEVYFNATGGAVEIRNTTITNNNSATRGGGVDRFLGSATGTISLASTIVAGNSVAGSFTAATADIGSNNASTISGNNNLIGIQDAATKVTLSGTGNQTGTTGAKLDAKLGALANNGGPTFTHALLAMSPALNMGNNDAGLTFDQRGSGFARSKGVTDVGSFEDQTVVAPPPQVSTIQIDDGTFQRSMVRSLVVTFNEPVNFSATSFQLTQTFNGSGTVGLTLSPLTGPASSVTITFNNSGTVALNGQNSLPDGKFEFRIVANNVNGTGGTLDGNKNGSAQGSPTDDSVTNLHRLFGDAEGNGTVNAADFNAFRLVYGNPAPGSIFDFDGLSGVNAADFNAFRTRYGASGFLP